MGYFSIQCSGPYRYRVRGHCSTALLTSQHWSPSSRLSILGKVIARTSFWAQVPNDGYSIPALVQVCLILGSSGGLSLVHWFPLPVHLGDCRFGRRRGRLRWTEQRLLSSCIVEWCSISGRSWKWPADRSLPSLICNAIYWSHLLRGGLLSRDLRQLVQFAVTVN